MNWTLALPELVLALSGLVILLGCVIPKQDTTQIGTMAVIGALIGVGTSVIGGYYYLRIIKVMYFDSTEAALDQPSSGASIVMALSGLFNVLFILWPAPIIGAAQAAVTALVG